MKKDILPIKVLIDGKEQKFEIDKYSKDRERDEEIVREAAKRLNSRLFEYRRDFKLDDAGAYLRMVALQYAIEVVEREYNDKASTTTKQLKDIEDILEQHLFNQ